MTTKTKPFDVRIAEFHRALPDDVRAAVEVFMDSYGARLFYDEMVANPDPNPNPNQRAMDAVMRGVMIAQKVPHDQWTVFGEILGEDLDAEFRAAVNDALKEFNLDQLVQL